MGRGLHHKQGSFFQDGVKLCGSDKKPSIMEKIRTHKVVKGTTLKPKNQLAT